MAKLLTVVISVLGLGGAVWNTLNVEKKAAALEEAGGMVSGLRQDLDTRDLNYRLAVQEYNFSTLHAATAYEIDRNEKILGAGVAPGTTMLREKAPAGQPRPAKAPSMREMVQQRRLLRTRAKTTAGPKPPELTLQLKTLPRLPTFARLLQAKLPQPPPGARPTAGAAPRSRGKSVGKIDPRLAAALKIARGAIRPSLTPERRRELVTIRGFQIENLSRWRQYMHQASTGGAMSEDEVDEWEGLLGKALIGGDDQALTGYAGECAKLVREREESHEGGRVEIEKESDRKAALEKQVDRGKSIYMGLVLVAIVLVTVKDLFVKKKG